MSCSWTLRIECQKGIYACLMRAIQQTQKTRLSNLPEGLEETYERIFSLVDPEDADLIRHALHFICFHDLIWRNQHNMPTALGNLLDLYLHFATECLPCSDEGRHILDDEGLKESCGFLLGYHAVYLDDTSIPCVRLADYTFRGVFESDRDKLHHASLYRSADKTCMRPFVLGYLRWIIQD